VHGALALAAAGALALQWQLAATNSPGWAALEAPVAAGGLLYAWRRQAELSLRLVLGLTLVFRVGSILVFRHLGYYGDQDPNDVYLSQGHELLHGTYPHSEYPVGAVLLFALEAGVEPSPPQVANAVLMLPAVLACVWAIWSLRTRWSGWLAACVGLWPLDAYYWQFRYDGVPAALLVVGLLLARRARYGWAGAVLAAGACFKWTPGLAWIVLLAWLLASSRGRHATRFASAFVLTCALAYVPFLVRWPAHDVLGSFRLQGGRSLTGESLWYWPARALGLASGTHPVWAPAGAPYWLDVAVTVVQVVLVFGVVAAAVRLRRRVEPPVALAALAPVVFLVTNRVFSAQFVLVLGASWAFAAACTARSNREQLLAGGGLAATATLTAFAYPFSDPSEFFSWRPYAAAAWAVILGVTAVTVRWAVQAVRSSARQEDSQPADFERWFARAAFATAAAIFALALLIAVTLPYGGWDSLYYGTWSRLIGLHGGFHFDSVVAVDLHRPLFYVLQGELWHAFGYHAWLGRLLSLFFTVVLVVCVVRIARHWGGRLTAAVAALVTLGITDVEIHASDGLTDVPAAATIALVAAILITVRRSPRRAVLLVVAALLAVLAKPSGLVGVASLCLASAIGSRAELRRRVSLDVAPMAAGLLLGLGYDWLQARHEHMGLRSFLQSGTGAGIWAQKSAAARPDALYGWDWLGRPLHVALVFACAYALLRVCTMRHRHAVLVAVPVAWGWSAFGPLLADHGFHPGFTPSRLATYALALALPATAFAPAQLVPSRLRVARLLVWAAPAVAVWTEYTAYDTRLVAAAWPALALLISLLVAGGLAALVERAQVLAAVAAAALIVLALANVTELNGFGHAGWQQYRSGGWSGVWNDSLMRNVAYGQFEYELDAVRRQLRPADRVFGDDGRLGFFFPGRVDYEQSGSCGDLAGFRVFVFLFSNESRALAQEQGGPGTIGSWESCRNPRLSLVAEIPGNYAVFTVGKPTVPPRPSDCGAAAPPPGLAAVFGSSRTKAGIDGIVRHVAKYGFIQVKAVQVNCEQFLALETGIPDEKTGRSIVAEARTVDVHVAIRRFG